MGYHERGGECWHEHEKLMTDMTHAWLYVHTYIHTVHTSVVDTTE